MMTLFANAVQDQWFTMIIAAMLLMPLILMLFFPSTGAFLDGVGSRAIGMPRYSNPYRDDDPRSDAWRDGWNFHHWGDGYFQ